MTWGFVTCGPNEALVISGCCHRKPLLIPGGRAFIWPTHQKLQRICLNLMTLMVDSPKVYSSQGVPISVTGVAQVKIQGQNEEMLLTACELFLEKSEKEIQHIALMTLEGHQRAIIGSMTVEEIYKDRKKFNAEVLKVASPDLVKMGITIVSYTLKDIKDESGGYLQNLGMAQTAQVKCAARKGEAEAQSTSRINQAIAEEQRLAAVYRCNIQIAEAQRGFSLAKCLFDAEVHTQTATSELAFELQTAKTKQLIAQELKQVEVVARQQQIQVEACEVERKRHELDAVVKQPALAERFRLQTLAEARYKEVVFEAEAEAEAIRLRSDAEAFAVSVKSNAESEHMAMKAEAFKQYGEAAMLDMYLTILPQVASAVAQPLLQTNKIKMVSVGGEVGPAKLTSEIINIVTKVPHFVKGFTGLDAAELSQ